MLPVTSVQYVFEEQQSCAICARITLLLTNILACVGWSVRATKRESNISSTVRTGTRPSVATAPFGTTENVNETGACSRMFSPGVVSEYENLTCSGSFLWF